MNREEFIGKLQMVYVGDRNAFNEIVDDNQKLKNEVVYSKVEINKLNNIIKNLDKMFEYYFLGNLKYDQDTVNTIYIKYVKLKELKENK